MVETKEGTWLGMRPLGSFFGLRTLMKREGDLIESFQMGDEMIRFGFKK